MRPPAHMGQPGDHKIVPTPPLMLVDHQGKVSRVYSVGAGVAALIVNQDDEILLIQRGPECSHGAGTWSLPGGWMEEGEQPWEAAVRETMEEIGLEVAPLVADVYPATSQYFPESGVHSVCLMVRCDALLQHDLSDLTLEPGKVSAVRWATEEQARDLPLFGHVRAYLDGLGVR